MRVLISSKVLAWSWRKKIVSISIPGPPLGEGIEAAGGCVAARLATAATKGRLLIICHIFRRVIMGNSSKLDRPSE